MVVVIVVVVAGSAWCSSVLVSKSLIAGFVGGDSSLEGDDSSLERGDPAFFDRVLAIAMTTRRKRNEGKREDKEQLARPMKITPRFP